MIEYSSFCLIVFIIQLSIAILNFCIAFKRNLSATEDMSVVVDVLCGISWLTTSGYWLWNFIMAVS